MNAQSADDQGRTQFTIRTLLVWGLGALTIGLISGLAEPNPSDVQSAFAQRAASQRNPVSAPEHLLISPREPNIHAPDVTFARLADFDDDGDLDVLAVEPNPQNRGSGRLVPSIHWYPNGGFRTRGDGSQFGPAANIGGSRRFDAQTYTITMATPADMDGDRDQDVLALVYRGGAGTHSLLWSRNGGGGSFSDFMPVVRHDGRDITDLTPEMRYIEAADVDNEGGDDFLMVDEDGKIVYWWKNLGPPEAPQFRRYRAAYMLTNDAVGARVHAADMDGDQDVDFVGILPGKNAASQTSPQGEIYWWRHQAGNQATYGGHEFVRQPLVGRQYNLLDVAAAPFDGDGLPDILALSCRTRSQRPALSQVVLWHNTGQDGEFEESATPEAHSDRDMVPPPPPQGGVWNSLDVGDMNGDGAPDFVAAEPVNESGVQPKQGMLCWYRNTYPQLEVPT